MAVWEAQEGYASEPVYSSVLSTSGHASVPVFSSVVLIGGFVQAWLYGKPKKGEETGGVPKSSILPTIAIVAPYDTFGLAPVSPAPSDSVFAVCLWIRV